MCEFAYQNAYLVVCTKYIYNIHCVSATKGRAAFTVKL